MFPIPDLLRIGRTYLFSNSTEIANNTGINRLKFLIGCEAQNTRREVVGENENALDQSLSRSRRFLQKEFFLSQAINAGHLSFWQTALEFSPNYDAKNKESGYTMRDDCVK